MEAPHSETMEAQPAAIEANPGVLKVHPRRVDAHPGLIDILPGAMKAHAHPGLELYIRRLSLEPC